MRQLLQGARDRFLGQRGVLFNDLLVRPAARLAIELGHPVYDCLYLVLAASRSAPLATADDRLRRAAERLGVPIWSHGGPATR